MGINVCSTLSGKVALKHPELGVLIREDGSVFRRKPRACNVYGWTYGSLAKNGYMVTTFRDGEKSIPFTIHRLVADCFIPNTDGKRTVDHINRIRTDNRVENLRWASYHEQSLNNSRHYAALEKWGFTPYDDRKTYNRVRDRVARSNKKSRGLRRFLCRDGKYRWIRAFSFEHPLSGEIAFRVIVSPEQKTQKQKEKKREYDKKYRALKGEERLRQKREYYAMHKDEINAKSREKRRQKRLLQIVPLSEGMN